MPELKKALFFDTVTLSNFALADALSLLVSRYSRRVHVTGEVLDEITDGVASGYASLTGIETAVTDGLFTPAASFTMAERHLYRDLLRTLAPGEASCIACAKKRHGVVVTDDRAARICCSEQKVPVTGTIGILKACCLDNGLLPEKADMILSAMIEAGYHAPVHRVSDLL